MSLVSNFFGKLRSVAVTLEKEADKLERAFSKDDEDYEDESPMRVLHNLHSEIKDLKVNLQSRIEKKHRTGQELNTFIRVCKVLQQRTSADIKQIKEMFQNYGYTPLSTSTADGDMSNGNLKGETNEQSSYDSELDDLPVMPAHEKPTGSWDLLRGPQLSDFGLSHYQFSSTCTLPSNTKEPAGETARPTFKDTRQVNVAKTPKCALRMEDDFTQVAHFGISDSHTNFNDDYTIALLKKAQTSQSVSEKDTSEVSSSGNLKNLLATPSHLSHRTNFDNMNSPTPPVFFTPGLKVHKKENVLSFETNTFQSEDTSRETDVSSRSAHLKHSLATPAHFSRTSHADFVDSPLPPAFCTPGLNVHKRENVSATVESSDPRVTNNNVTPPLPAFETNYLKNDPATKCLDVTEPIPRPKVSHSLYFQDTAPLVLNSNKYYENTSKMASPPQMKNYSLDTPLRPEMTTSLTEDLIKYNMKASSPPKVSGYENLLWTPTRPEMTSCVTEDISQIFSRFSNNKMNDSETARGTKPALSSNQGIMAYKDKENRL